MNATLPNELTINGVVHVQHFRGKNYVVLQNYSATTAPSDEPIIAPGGIIQGSNQFHLYEIQHTPGESLGQKLGTYSDLQGAMVAAQKLQLS